MFWSELPVAGRWLTEAPGWSAQIYALVDPSDESIRYVGKTTIGLVERLALHRKKPLRSLAAWLSSMAGPPEIRLITFATEAAVNFMEMDWIAKIRVRHLLLNVDPGGNYRDASGEPRPIMKRIARRYARQARREAFVKAPRRKREQEKPRDLRQTFSGRLAEISRKQMDRSRR